MGRKYCVFWFPTIFHNAHQLLKNKLERKGLDDIASSFTLWVSLKIVQDGKNENIEITLDRQSLPTLVVILYEYSRSSNGLRCYYYDFPKDRLDESAQFEKLLKIQIYHYAKDFYHSHEVLYGEEKDGFLEAIIDDNEIKICEKDNTALINYLQQFAKRFEVIAHTISDYNNVVNEVEILLNRIKYSSDTIRQKDKLKESQFEIRSKELIRTILRHCEDALIEYTYYNTLLCSIYNSSFHQNQTKCEITQDNNRKFAINVENSINYIKCIQYKNSHRINYISLQLLEKLDIFNKTSKRSLKLSSLLAIFSVTFALLSLDIFKNIWTKGCTKGFWNSIESFDIFTISIFLIFVSILVCFVININKNKQ